MLESVLPQRSAVLPLLQPAVAVQVRSNATAGHLCLTCHAHAKPTRCAQHVILAPDENFRIKDNARTVIPLIDAVAYKWYHFAAFKGAWWTLVQARRDQPARPDLAYISVIHSSRSKFSSVLELDERPVALATACARCTCMPHPLVCCAPS